MSNLRILPIPLGGGGVTPTGTLEIRSEGVFDVTNYAEVDVDIFDDTTTKNITANGIYNAEDDQVLGYSQVTVAVPASAVDTGTKQTVLTENGVVTENVVGYANNEITVNVPASAVDTGTKSDTITINGTSTIDVVGYANHEVIVNVPASAVDVGTLTIEPITQNVTLFTQDVTGYRAIAFQVAVPASEVDTGTKQDTITTNGTSTINVVGYANHEVTVAVPASAVDSGTKQITQNGANQDVVGYAAVDVNVQPNLQAKSNIDPTTSSQTVTADQNYDGLSSVQINSVTAAVDANIIAGNIKNGVSILGVTGSYTGEGIIPTGTLQITRNGIHDVTQYASAEVNVPSQSTDFFCIEANAASSVQLIPYGGYVFHYSNDKTNWSDISTQTTLNLAQGDKVYFYGDKTPATDYRNSQYNTHIALSGNVSISGSLMTLCDVSGGQYPPYGAFGSLFFGSTATIDASNLILPKYNSEGCYYSMFYNCTGLTVAPALPATTLYPYCYAYMFQGCTSLVNAPALPATTLKNYCYQNMFQGCTSLVNAPALPATNIAQYCYSNMFQECTSLVNAPALPATDLVSYCYQNMFKGCTSLVNAPALPATTLKDYCYGYMFQGCTSLVNAPALPATTLVYYCYYYMFSGCTALTEAPDLLHVTKFNTICIPYMFYNCSNLSRLYIPNVSSWSTSYANNWVNGVAATGTVLRVNENITIPVDVSGIPSGWTTIVCPEISIDYTNMEITLSTDVVGADLYYSTNDTDAPAQFSQYTGPIAIPSGSNFFKVRAYLVDSGNMSGIISNAYNNYFYIEAAGSNSVNITFQRDSYPEYPKQNTEFSFDRITWSRVDSVSYISVPNGDRVYFRRNVTNSSSQYGIFADGDTSIQIGNSQGKVGGCISSLLFKTTDPKNTDIKSRAVRFLFSNSTSIIDAQNLIIDISNLPNESIQGLFYNCTSLTTAPDLSNVTAIGNSGMRSCFYGCTSLTTAPDLSNVTAIGNSGMQECFNGCTSLTTAPDLSNVTAIGNSGMQYCFRSCKFTTAPDLSNVTAIGNSGMQYCFYYCSLLTSITAPNVSIWDTNAFSNWAADVAASGTLYAPTGVTIPTNSVSGIPYGWTRVDY